MADNSNTFGEKSGREYYRKVDFIGFDSTEIILEPKYNLRLVDRFAMFTVPGQKS